MSDPIGDKARDVRDEDAAVSSFAGDMRAKLRANSHKEHWGDTDAARLWDRAHDELSELPDAIECGTPQEIIAECADVANFVMMIADNERKKL